MAIATHIKKHRRSRSQVPRIWLLFFASLRMTVLLVRRYRQLRNRLASFFATLRQQWDLRRGLELGLLLAVLAGGFRLGSAADERAKPSTEKSPAESPRMLLLHSGRTVEGKILKAGDNYIVKRESGEMLVPKTMVKLECADIHDAYEQLRKELPHPPDVERHLDLARWCMNAQIFEEARDEARVALAASPGRDDIRAMVANLNEIIDPKPPGPAAPPGAKSQALKTSPFSEEDLETLHGLSRSSAQHYVRRIQPILMNNCMLTGCHGTSSQSELKLMRVHGGRDGNRLVSEQNLVSVLRFVKMDSPKQSPLLLVPEKGHGRRGGAVFAGGRGPEQAREIRDWVLTVSKEFNKKQHRKETVVDLDSKTPRRGESNVAESRTASRDKVAADPTAKIDPKGVVREMLDLPSNADPFSPDAFNQRR